MKLLVLSDLHLGFGPLVLQASNVRFRLDWVVEV